MENPNLSVEVVLDDLALADPEEMTTFAESILGETTDIPKKQISSQPAPKFISSPPTVKANESEEAQPEPIFITTFSSDLGGQTSPRQISTGALGSTRNLLLQAEKKEVLQILDGIKQNIMQLISAFNILRQLKLESGTLLNENSPEFYRSTKQSQEILTSLKPHIVSLQSFKVTIAPDVRASLLATDDPIGL